MRASFTSTLSSWRNDAAILCGGRSMAGGNHNERFGIRIAMPGHDRSVYMVLKRQ
jgi:hypothetical protein